MARRRFRTLAAFVVFFASFAAPTDAQRGGGQSIPSQRPEQGPPPPADALILGRVVDADSNQPLGGVVVGTTLPLRPPAPGAVPARPEPIAVLTNAQGHFVFRDLPPGSFNLNANLDGYAPGAFGRTRPGGGSRPVRILTNERRIDIEIRMWKYATISGRVVDEAGEPAVGISVRAIDADGRAPAAGGMTNPQVRTDDRGQYRLTGLLPGAYVLAAPSTVAAVPGSVAGAYRQAATNGDIETFTRSMSESRAPIPGAGGLRVGDHILMLSGGSFAQSGLPPPPVGPGEPLRLYPTTYHPSATDRTQAAAVVVGSGTELDAIDIALSPVETAAVSGIVLGPAGPAPNVGVHITPTSAGGNGFVTMPSDLPAASAVTDAAGRFTILGVPAGQYTVGALIVPRPTTRPATTMTTVAGGVTITTSTTTGPPEPPRDPMLWARTTVTVGGADVAGLQLELRPGPALSGQVVFEGAAPPPPPGRLQAYSITLMPEAGMSMVPMLPVRPGADGRFQTQSNPPGRYRVQTATSLGEWVVKSVTVNERDVTGDFFDIDDSTDRLTITLTDRRTALEGSVSGSAAAGAADGGTIVVLPADIKTWISRGMSPGRRFTAAVNRQGTFRLAYILPGDYSVVALPDDVAVELEDAGFVTALARAATRVTVVEGQTATVSLAFTTVR